MKEISHSCCILAHTNSKVFWGKKTKWHLHLPDTQLHTNTVSGRRVFLIAIYSVMGTKTRHSLKHSCASAGSHSLTKEILLNSSVKLGGPIMILKKCPSPPAHRIVNDR